MRMEVEIRSEGYLWVGETLTKTEDLTPMQREELAVWLKEKYLNELCRGRFSFSSEGPGATPSKRGRSAK